MWAMVDWAKAQVAEDERVAREATPGRWKLWAMEVRADIDGTSNLDTSLPVAQTYHEAGLRTCNATHIAIWGPARVLALTKALRKALDEFSWEAREVDILAGLVEALYSDRDGYQEEWRP